MFFSVRNIYKHQHLGPITTQKILQHVRQLTISPSDDSILGTPHRVDTFSQVHQTLVDGDCLLHLLSNSARIVHSLRTRKIDQIQNADRRRAVVYCVGVAFDSHREDGVRARGPIVHFGLGDAAVVFGDGEQLVNVGGVANDDFVDVADGRVGAAVMDDFVKRLSVERSLVFEEGSMVRGRRLEEITDLVVVDFDEGAFDGVLPAVFAEELTALKNTFDGARNQARRTLDALHRVRLAATSHAEGKNANLVPIDGAIDERTDVFEDLGLRCADAEDTIVGELGLSFATACRGRVVARRSDF